MRGLVPFSKDIFRFISLYLSPHDIVNVATTCSHLEKLLLQDETLWRQYVAFYKAGGIPLMTISKIVDVDFWKHVAFTKNIENAQRMLKFQYLKYRMEIPLPSDKDFLRFFVCIHTKGKRPKRDLLGDVIPNQFETVKIPSVTIAMTDMSFSYFSQKQLVTLTFKHTASFLFWYGESGFKSTVEVYGVDRHCLNTKVNIYSKSNECYLKSLQSCVLSHVERLSPTQAIDIGQRYHNDPNYFVNTRDTWRFVSENTNKSKQLRVRDDILVQSSNEIQVVMNIDEFYNEFL